MILGSALTIVMAISEFIFAGKTAGIMLLISGAVLLAVFFYYTKKRYRRIEELNDYLVKILSGDSAPDIQDQEEGELSILADNIYKEIHRSFATLSQEEQRFAEMIIYDLQNGNLFVDDEKSFRDYLNEYQIRIKNDQIHKFAVAVGYDEELLRKLVSAKPNEASLDEYGQFEPLKDSLNVEVASAYFEKKNGKKLPKPIVIRDAENLVKKFILSGGFDIDQ